MRSSATGLGLSPELANLTRRADSPVKQMIEALNIAHRDIRQQKAQWALADSLVGLTLGDDGGVKPTDTTSTLIQQDTAETAFFTDAQLRRVPFPFTGAAVEWAGTEPADIEINQVIAKLHPRVNPVLPKSVFWWRLDLYRITALDTPRGVPRQLWLSSIYDGGLKVLAQGDAEGYVTFDFTTAAVQGRARPKRLHGITIFDGFTMLFNAFLSPTTILAFSALREDGSPATNVGLAYDAAQASVASGGNILSGRVFLAPSGVTYHNDKYATPASCGDGGAAAGTPRIIIKSGTFANTKIQFSSGANRIDLGAVPTGDVVFTINGAVPPGTQLVGQVLKDGGVPATDADWVTFPSGGKVGDAAIPNVTKRQFYEIRANFLTDPANATMPTLRKLAVEEYTSTDLSEVAEIRLQGGYGIDAVTLQGELVRGILSAIRDGEHDYRSAIENLLAAADLGKYTFRLWIGAPALAKQFWLHIDDYLPLGQTPHATTYEIPVISPLVKIRGLLPKKSPGASITPDADLFVGAYTTETGAGAPLFSHINEVAVDQLTYIRSELDPVASIYKASFPTPADLPGRKLYLDYFYMKDVAGGKTIDATIEIRQNVLGVGVLIMTQAHLNIPGPDSNGLPAAGSVRLSDASVAAITDPTNLELWITFNVGGAGGSRRGILTWARFRTGDRRQGVSYSNQTGKAVYHDLLVNQLEVGTQWIGAELEDTTYLIGKVISEITSDEQPTGKSELDAVAKLFGCGVLGSQGKLKVVNMRDPGPVVATFPMEEIKILAITPGIEDRTEDYVVPFNWNAQKTEFDDECELVSAAGVLAFGDAKLDNTPPREDQEVAKWIISQAGADYAVHARAVAKRMIDWFAMGRGRCLFESDYRFPEIEPGDTVALEQDQLVLRDPNTGQEWRGIYWILGKIELCDDELAMGRRFTMAYRPFFDLFAVGSGESTRSNFVAPVVRSIQLPVDDGGNVLANISVTAGLAVRVAAATGGIPSDATARAAALQLVDGNGQLTTATLLSIIPGQVGFVKVFAYEHADGSGAESLAVTAATPKGTRKRAFVLDDGLYILPAIGPSGLQAAPAVKLDPANGIYEGGVVQLLYRHREEITINGADADGDVDVSFAQAYQNAPMILFKGGQYVSFSQTLGTGAGVKHRLRVQAVNVTTSGFKSRAQLVNTGATTAQDDDFPAADVLTAAGQTTVLSLNPGGANDDTYNVQYFCSITLSSPGVDPLITLDVAIDTDDGLGGGFIERATFSYSRSTGGTSTATHENKPIVVTGLLVANGAKIRIRAKSFLVHDAPGSSFIVRGGDNGATDTFHGVQYTTATDVIESAIPAAGDSVAWVAQEVT